MSFVVDLTGGPPWGFSMTGGADFNFPLTISKVTSGSKASSNGIRPDLGIIAVNGQNVAHLRHMDAIQYIKEVSRTGRLRLELSQIIPRRAEDLNSILGGISTVPTMYREEDENDVINYRPIDHKESQRRIYEDSAASGGAWRPDAYQSTQQSPSFMKAVKPPTGASAKGSDISKPIEIDINPDLAAMINESDQSGPVFQPKPVVASQSAPPVSVNIRTYDPHEPPTQVQPASNAHGSPTPNSAFHHQQQRPAPPTTVPSHNNNGVAQHQQPVHDLRNPEKSGVLRLPTVNFKPQPANPTPRDAKSSALGNISSFMNKQSNSRGGNLGKPEFLQPLADKEFPLGEPAVLEVRCVGQAPLTVQWYHNNQPIRESVEKDIRLLQKGNVYTLVYGELSQRELGRYSCQASNNKGSVTCSCIMTEGGYEDEDCIEQYPTATYQRGPPQPANPAFSQSVNTSQSGLPARTKVVSKKPLNQLVTSGNADLYSQGVLEEGLHSALGIQGGGQQGVQQPSAVLDAIEGRNDRGPRQSSRTMARLAQKLDDCDL